MKNKVVVLFERFEDFTKEQKQALTLKDFTVSELTAIIEETILTDVDKQIAKLRFIKLLSFDKISDQLLFDSRTIRKHIIYIEKALSETIMRIL